MPTPGNISFDRRNFLSGGSYAERHPLTLTVFPADNLAKALYKFDQMLVYKVSCLDSEHLSYLQASNDTVKLFSFDRSVIVLSVQAAAIDAVGREGDDEPGAMTQRAYERFIWLYENELRIAAATFNKRIIRLDLHDHSYYGFLVSLTEGTAADADHLVPLTFEFIVLRSTGLKPAYPGTLTSTASAQLLRQVEAPAASQASGGQRPFMELA